MKRLVYRIDHVEDREGNKKEIPENWLQAQYVVSRIKLGHSAILTMLNGDKYLRTSTVEDVVIYDNTIALTTRNTVYWLAPRLEVIEK